jgi:hypothetical protein
MFMAGFIVCARAFVKSFLWGFSAGSLTTDCTDCPDFVERLDALSIEAVLSFRFGKKHRFELLLNV